MGMVMLVREEQYSKVLFSMEVTELGMVTLDREEHPEKAAPPMEVTELGMVMLVKEEQFLKAAPPMEVTELGMTVFLHPAIKVLVAVLIKALQLFRLSNTGFPVETTMEVILVSP